MVYRFQTVQVGDIVHYWRTGENRTVLEVKEDGDFVTYKSYRAFGDPEMGVRVTDNVRNGHVEIIKRFRPRGR